jgi:diguanylate cyclase (GGDEF)-like protein
MRASARAERVVAGVSLRTRLFLVLGALFLVPIMVGALVLALVIPGIASDRLQKELAAGSVAVSNEIADECQLLGLAARTVALEAASSSTAEAVRTTVRSGYASYAAVLAPDKTVAAQAGSLPAGVAGPGALTSCTRSRQAGPVLADSVPVTGAPGVQTAVVARVLDRAFLAKLADRAGMVSGQVVLLNGDRVLASSLPPDQTKQIVAGTRGRDGVTEVGDWVTFARDASQASPYRVIVAAEVPGTATGSILPFALILLAGAVAAGLLVTSVARSLSQPFADLTAAAERVASGDLDARVDGLPEGEAGRLGDAFNRMTTDLRRNMTALEQSREDLRDSLERIGDTLMSTHDLEGLLQVVLETATVTLRARAGVVLYGAPDQLRVVAEHGLHAAGLSAPTEITVGAGVLGRVVASGESIRGSIGSGPSELAPLATEPGEGDILATPLRSMGAVTGVLALYGRENGKPFDATDDDALRTLSGQASTAIDNVQLHQEAQRLSTTDALTGLWNFRYLSMSLAREIERSTRFERPLAVLMLDLDHFKRVNDTYGHARGDAVLRELAHRVQEQIREVDTFARYGGEEFVVVLPETTVDGAAQLAERICVAVRRTPFQSEGEEPLDITLSVGGAAFPEHGSSAATLMRAADRALYVAKGEGRDRWHVPGHSEVVQGS